VASIFRKNGKHQNNRRRDGNGHHVDHEVDPVGGVCLCWNGHEGDRAQHRSEDAQSSHKPWDALAAAEKIVGTLVAEGEEHADADHRAQVDEDDRKVDEPEVLLALEQSDLPHRRRSDAWADFAACNDDGIVHSICSPANGGGRYMIRGNGAGGGPCIGDGVVRQGFFGDAGMFVSERVSFIEQAAIGTAKDENMALPHGNACARHDASWRVTSLTPGVELSRVGIGRGVVSTGLVAGGCEFVDVREESSSPALPHSPPAKNVQAIFDAVVLGSYDGERTGWARPRKDTLPFAISFG